MSDKLTHECGIAVVRLKKPLAYYQDRYGTALWGFNKLFLLMEKQHNRGQDGVGIGCAKIGMPAGESSGRTCRWVHNPENIRSVPPYRCTNLHVYTTQ